jgi:glycosyltransferase involved in cell wall biosynthesis
MRGGEKVLEVLCEIFPKADVFTLLHVPGRVSATIESHPVRTSVLQRFPRVEQRYRYYLPLMPWAIERFDFSEYDFLISSSHCVAKGARPQEGALHVCYCLTPMRFIWDQYDSYFARERAGWPVRVAMGLLRRRLQRWDAGTSGRVHIFAAISSHVAERIRRFYHRDVSAVIYPPVDVNRFGVGTGTGGYYLVVSALAPYKRIDLAIAACRQLRRKLKIVGTGSEERPLREMAGPDAEFLGWRRDDEVAQLYRDAEALLFPGEEDFGIVPLEAQASGRPVIAFGSGGVCETVMPLTDPEGASASAHGSAVGGPTGVFFGEQNTDALVEAILTYERHRTVFDPRALRQHAARFDRRLCKARLTEFFRETCGMDVEVS